MPQQAYVYGHVPDVSFGATFTSRDELMKASVHAVRQAGIHGDPKPGGGAYSICISGGYEDNKDMGERITYVGSGGQDSHGQIGHQSFDDPANQSLFRSSETKLPVRVIRGRNDSSYYSPSSGYRYDGLYVVDSARMGVGKEGFNMCFFELRRIREEGDGPLPTRRLLTSKKLTNMLKNAGK